MNTHTYSIKKIGNDKLLRGNVKTAILQQKITMVDIDEPVRIKDFFDIISGFAFSSNDYVANGIPLVRIGDLNDGALDFDSMVKLPLEFYEDTKFDKYKIKKDDILVSLTGDGSLKCSYVNSNQNCLLNQRVAILRKKNNSIRTQFYYWMLQTEYVKNQFSYFSNGKSQLNISPFDFANIKLPLIKEEIQKKVLDAIFPIEKEIDILAKSIISPAKTIDTIFKEKFNFDYETFENLKKCKRHTLNQVSISNNNDLRFSAKFHRCAGEYVISQLMNLSDKKIKHFLSEPIVLGASISPSDYNDDGDYYYISMATIKSWHFDSKEASNISKKYYDAKSEKKIRKNDIILARSGEGTIGKVALIDSDEINGIFADFTMRIRLEDYNQKFAYYYFRTSYFQYLIEIYKKGLGNNTNIFPVVIQEFPLPDISLTEQQKIVDEIQAEINKQHRIINKIASLRCKIESIIDDTLKSND